MGAKTLVVEDDVIMSAFLEKALDTFGHDVSLATNGVEALRIIVANEFDLLVTDINMPVMDGVSLINEIKRQQIHIPNIIICTGRQKNELPEDLWDVGIRYLPKPFNLAQLKEFIQTSQQSLLESSGLGTHHNFPHLLG